MSTLLDYIHEYPRSVIAIESEDSWNSSRRYSKRQTRMRDNKQII